MLTIMESNIWSVGVIPILTLLPCLLLDVTKSQRSFASNGNLTIIVAGLINPCSRAPCRHAGTCIVTSYPRQTYSCQCLPGYTGLTCAEDINECALNPCHNGTCVDYNGFFRCHCYQGYTGELCEIDIDECQSSPCQHGATCRQTVPGQYACLCAQGYQGFRCETDIDECVVPSPCQNGGVCRQGAPGTYTCGCLPGWTGRDCEQKVLECTSRPCQNGGLCQEGHGFRGGVQCDCLPGFTGRWCEEPLNSCTLIPSRCGEGLCIPILTGNGYRCLCFDGAITETSCEAPYNPCLSLPCQHGSRCVQETNGCPIRILRPVEMYTFLSAAQGSYHCECRPGFEGPTCQGISFPCGHTNLCRNGGTCYQLVDGRANCLCPFNFTGNHCDIEVNQCNNSIYSCQHEGKCFMNETSDGIHCECVDGYWGTRCQAQDPRKRTPLQQGHIFTNYSIDNTLLFSLLGLLGALVVLVAAVMLVFYLCRKKRPHNRNMSVPETRSASSDSTARMKMRPCSTFTVNNDFIVNRNPSSDVRVTPPCGSFHVNSKTTRF